MALRAPRTAKRALCALASLAALGHCAVALGAGKPVKQKPTPGALVQLQGTAGCLSGQQRSGCARVRALLGPAPFLGSGAVAISPDGRNVYVVGSRSDSIAVFKRAPASGRLSQPSGTGGCVAAAGASGCGRALGLYGPNSVAVSPDGRNVYATSLVTNAVDAFRRNPATGALTQLGAGAGCLAAAFPGCTVARALAGPDVVTVSADGRSVYVGSFTGNAVAVFSRNSSTGALSQPEGTAGCVAAAAGGGCALATALGAPEGLAVSPDGTSVYVAAALSNAVDVFARNPSTGALAQAAQPSGCIVESPLLGCTTGLWLGGADAVAVSHDDRNVYVTSVLSNSLTTFSRNSATGQLTQQPGTSGCVVYVLAVGCSLGRALQAPEGLAVPADGESVYTTAFSSGAIDVYNRNVESGSVMQKPRSAGCLTTNPAPDCAPARGLAGVSSAAVSPDGRNLYAAAFASGAVTVFKRTTER